MSRLEVRRNKKNYELNAYYGDGGKGKAIYHNILDNDPKKLAQILLDLELVENFKIFDAVMIYLERRKRKDWLGNY